MSARDDILNRLRGTLQRADLPFPPVNPRPLTAATRMTVTNAGGTDRELAARFGAELEKLHGSYEIVGSMAEARLALMNCLLRWASEAEAGKRGPRPETGQERTVLAWAPERLPVTGVAETLTDMEFGFIAPDSVLTAEARERIRHIRYGVTGVEAAFASTGSMMMVAGPGTNRSASLLPLRHIALIPTSRLYPTMESWLAELREVDRLTETLRQAANWSMITGPSKSADIGGELTLGVHGPKFVHAILFSDNSSATDEHR
jgi:L-lactate utilization protein LutC